MMDDTPQFLSKHPDHQHCKVPWTDQDSTRLVKVWRTLLESQNGPGVDGSELPEDGGTIGYILRTFVKVRSRVLVLGAGRGQEVAYANRVGHDAFGLSLGPMNIAIAREAGLNVMFLDAHATAFPTCAVDVVIGLQVLEHSPAPLLLLLECARLLRPGGLLAIKTPAATAHTGTHTLHHILCPTPRQVQGLLDKSGFVRTRQYNAVELLPSEIDRSDIRLLTIAERASDAELEAFDPETRLLVRGQ